MLTLRRDFFDPPPLALACFTGDFWAVDRLADLPGALAATDLVVLPAFADESAFFASACVFFESVAAWLWAPSPKPSSAPTNTAALNTCFICYLLPEPREF